jgi:hypothetical protein
MHSSESWQPGSKMTRNASPQKAKQDAQIVSTDEGMQTDRSDEHP